MRLRDHPRLPKAKTWLFFSSLKTLLIPEQKHVVPAPVNVPDAHPWWPVFRCPLVAGFGCPPRKEWTERRGDGEDEMEITHRQQMLLLSLRPYRLIETTTARAVAVSAGVVGVVTVATPVTVVDVSAEATGAATDDVSRGLALLGRQTQRGHVIAQHVGDTDCGALAAGHAYSLPGFESSRGLFTSPSQFLARRT
jgi:hypothetical protein